MSGLEGLGLIMLIVMIGVIFIGFPISFTMLFLAFTFGYLGLGKIVFDLAYFQTIGLMKEPTLAAQKDAKTNEPAEDDIYRIGTLGTVVQLLRLPDGTVKVLVEGKKRARIAKYVDDGEYFLVDAEPLDESFEKTTEIEALIRTVNSTFENYVKLNKKIPPEMIMSVQSIDEPSRLSDTIVRIRYQARTKQQLLEMMNRRTSKVLVHAVRDRDPRGRSASARSSRWKTQKYYLASR
jgi:Lon protease-like protein